MEAELAYTLSNRNTAKMERELGHRQTPHLAPAAKDLKLIRRSFVQPMAAELAYTLSNRITS
jgi:hypothetical protein